MANSGSAAGDVDFIELPAIGVGNMVNEGDLITVTSDGGSTAACVTRFKAVIKRGRRDGDEPTLSTKVQRIITRVSETEAEDILVELSDGSSLTLTPMPHPEKVN